MLSMPQFSTHMLALQGGDLQLRLPNLLAPPGLEMFGPTSLPIKAKDAEKQDMDDEDCLSDVSATDCSTADLTESAVSSPKGSSQAYRPGEMLQQCADISRPESANRSLILLEEALPEEEPGSPGCPSIGSAAHALGLCKPCDFMHRGGCRLGYSCQFCHLCSSGETRRRKKMKQAANRVATQMCVAVSQPQDAKVAKQKQKVSLTLDDLVQ